MEELERYGLNIILEYSSIKMLFSGLCFPFLDYSLACILCNNLEAFHEENLLKNSYSALALMLGALYNFKCLSMKVRLPKLQEIKVLVSEGGDHERA